MTQRGEKLPELVAIMERLLSPDGCPWDREQTLESLRPYVIEEAYEVVDAIERKDLANLREELGDLLLQIVFQSALARGQFGIDDVIAGICDKLVRRHPHVFGSERAHTSDQVRERWEALKAKEKAGRGVLDGVPRALPGLLRALRVGEKAAHLGLDWPDAEGPREKLGEELRELERALAAEDSDAIERELGDVLFAVVNLARKRGLDPEAALQRTLETFVARVEHVEAALCARAEPLAADELDLLWNAAKEAVARGQR